ncbi:MAG: UPF0175 family protein [Gammaproteobacteria bacterium]|nr:UPF0175 family protein [Gammaproteobacteria bacterium]MBI5616302.1 UPF0175 family protein [Gammaproteobacteria bacterium]
MQTFTVRDLRERIGELVRNAEAGKLSLVTKDGQPVFLAVPFDDALLQEGLRVALAVKLTDEEVITVSSGARMAGMTLRGFMSECSARHVPVVRYPPEELERELQALDDLPDCG